jgi:hypothetical protein
MVCAAGTRLPGAAKSGDQLCESFSKEKKPARD